MKKCSGITLIALVITIIVLLILAGVSLSLIAGENGVLRRATTAVEKNRVGTAKEEVELVVADFGAEYFEKKYDMEIEEGSQKAYIQSKLEPGVATNNYFAKANGDKLKVYEGKEVSEKAVAKGTIKEDGTIEWDILDPFLEEANSNPEKYRHPEQSAENKTLGIGTDGKAVNMDLWAYDTKIHDTHVEGGYTLTEHGYSGWGNWDYDCAYFGTDFDNIIMPQYIKSEEDEEFVPVVELHRTFSSTISDKPTKLVKAPEIPKTVVRMTATFEGCTNLTQAPEIPGSVTGLAYTFDGCTSLTQAPEILGSVTSLNHTFDGCTSLTQASEIPGSVIDLYYTFNGCTSLTQVPEIPGSVTSLAYTFKGCTSLTQAPEIPGSVTSLSSTFEGCTSLTQAPEIPDSVTSMEATFKGCTSLSGV